MMDDLLSGCRRIEWGRLVNHTTIITWSTCLQNSCNKNQQICGAIIDDTTNNFQFFNDTYNVQWFRCILGRAWGAIRSLRCLVIVEEWPIEFWSGGGWRVIETKHTVALLIEGVALQPLWGIIAVEVGKQSTTIADEIGHVFADLLSINLRG